jgi:hypothetical protein
MLEARRAPGRWHTARPERKGSGDNIAANEPSATLSVALAARPPFGRETLSIEGQDAVRAAPVRPDEDAVSMPGSRGRMLPWAGLALLLATRAASQAPSPRPHTGDRTPDGRPVCSKWVHERHTVTGADGRRYATWHPLVDPTYDCVFGHEHGSDPRAFLGFRQSGLPPFGAAATAAAGRPGSESHTGYKVFVVNNDGRGKAFMIVVHQDTDTPERARGRHHSMELWMVRRTDRSLLAHTSVMADFGEPVANCEGQAGAAPMRLIPRVGCESPEEEWTALVDVDGRLKARPAFLVENPSTRYDPTTPDRVHPNSPAVCGQRSPFGWESACKGDRRVLLHPQWVVRNDGPSHTFHTDAFGAAAPGPGPGRIEQYVRRGVMVDESAECCGEQVVYVMTDRDDGSTYRNNAGFISSGIEGPEPAVRWPN